MIGVESSLTLIAFVGLPYASAALFVFGLLHRIREHNFSIVSPSSQFLENRLHFWALVPFHYGLLLVLLVHLWALLAPSSLLFWNSNPVRLIGLEWLTLSAGLLTLFGISASMVRRIRTSSLRRLTRKPDWLLFSMISFQVLTGILTALFSRWGTSWFAAAGTPFLRSLFLLSPDVNYIATAPLLLKLHVINAFLLLAYLPFSKLIHALIVPLFYFWRPLIVFKWRGRKQS